MSFQMILTGTPWWVFAILAYGIFIGVRALFPRKVSLVAVSALPVVMVGISVISLISMPSFLPLSLIGWALALAVGSVVGVSVLSVKVSAVHREKRQVELAPDAWTGILFLSVFVNKYILGILQATKSPLASDSFFMVGMLTLSAISSGIFLGRSFSIYRHFRSFASK